MADQLPTPMTTSRRRVQFGIVVALSLALLVFLYFLWWALHGVPGMTASHPYERPSQ